MASTIKTYRDLIVWQRSMELVSAVYRATVTMPAEERFGLTSQMRRAAISIPSNIAEGFSRQSPADYLKFLRIARGSIAELSTQWEIAQRLGLLGPEQSVEALLTEADRILQGLIRAISRTNAKPRRSI